MKQIQQIAEKIKNANAFLIGASNGLSITEGIHLFANNTAMHDLFGDLQARYGIQNLLQGMMGRWPSAEQLWGFWSRMVNHYNGSYQATQVMKDLKAIIGGKDYFIVTSNGEQHFQLAGFDPQKVYEVEGDWLHLTCSQHCCGEIVPGMEQIRTMAAAERDGLVPTELIPRCPHCGAPMVPTMAAGVVDPAGKENYLQFLRTYHGKDLVILELGIGARNQLIKAPLMGLTAHEPNFTYVTFNLSELYIAPDIAEKSFAVEGYLNTTLGELRQVCTG